MPTKLSNMQKDFIKRAKQDIEVISHEIQDLLHQEDVYLNRIIPQLKKDKVDRYIAQNISKTHYSTMLVAIRRQVGTDKGEISLKNLLTKLRDNHTLITKDWYVSEWHEGSSLAKAGTKDDLQKLLWGIPRGEFEKYFGKDVLDPKIVERSLKKLEVATKTIKDYVDKKVAHRDKVPPGNVTNEEYQKALKVVEKIAQKYILLLNQVGMPSLTPVIQD